MSRNPFNIVVGACGLLPPWARRKKFWIFLSAGISVAGVLLAAPPVAVHDKVNTLIDTAVIVPVLANDSDADNDQLAIHQVKRPAHGWVQVNTNPVPLNAVVSNLLHFAGIQLSNSVMEIIDTNQYPRSTRTNGTWITHPVGIYNWVSGFFPGSLWHLYEQTADTRYRTWAENWMAGIAPMQYATQVDDVGFMINTSFGTGYRLTGNPEWSAILLQTARSFSTRYNAAARVLSTWGAVTNQPFDVFIDTMMNLEVLFRAYHLGGDTNFFTFAYNHAERTMLNHVRPDGSTYHIVRYDGKTGVVLSRGTFAGVSDDSTWARGQAWAIYAFTMAYQETGDAKFLDTARRVTNYYLTNAPSDGVPYWDFQAPGIPNAPRDSSAAAIALSGLIPLSQIVTNQADSSRYWKAACDILNSLGLTNYLAQPTNSRGILLHGVGEPPHLPNPEVDVSLVYGDYYFIEALNRYAGLFRQNTLTYKPKPGFQGTDTFNYQVCDSGGNCSTAVVTVVVEPLAPTPPHLNITQSAFKAWPTIRFPSTAGRTYDVHYRGELMEGGLWSNLATNIPGSGSILSIVDTNPPGQRYYRVHLKTPEPPP